MTNPYLHYRIGDVFDRLAEIPDGSIDLIVSSPPFLALRSYLPDDHPDKGKEIGQEPTPAAFIETHLELAAEYARVLAPHGTLCYEIGDTYSGSGGGGGDYLPGGMRDGQPGFSGSNKTQKEGNAAHWRAKNINKSSWPLAKSMCIIPHMFTGSLAYGRNLLTGEQSPAGEWRIRNVICWARPNPPVGALGDKFRPATSYITVACKGKSRYFDLDAVRTIGDTPPQVRKYSDNNSGAQNPKMGWTGPGSGADNPAGAPPLDWHADNHPEDGDWLWKLSTQPYKGSHYATYPMALPKRLIEAMCPLRVCNVCGKPSERITSEPEYVPIATNRGGAMLADQTRVAEGVNQWVGKGGASASVVRTTTTTGWSDCGHDDWRTGIVLDPFGGSGTTAEAAQTLGRSAICIDIDERNANLAQQRVGMFLQVEA